MSGAGGRAAGAVLAGGASRRFGSDKAEARFAGERLVDRVRAVLRGAGAGPVAVVGGPRRQDDGAIWVPDADPGEGPLGGLVTALRWSPRPWTVVVAVDMPLLDDLTVAAVVERAVARPGHVAAARAEGRLQPTCACWPADSLAPLERAFQAGERSIGRILGDLPIEPVDVPDRVVGDADTPARLAELCELALGRGA